MLVVFVVIDRNQGLSAGLVGSLQVKDPVVAVLRWPRRGGYNGLNKGAKKPKYCGY
jgi:hypothetical protein